MATSPFDSEYAKFNKEYDVTELGAFFFEKREYYDLFQKATNIIRETPELKWSPADYNEGRRENYLKVLKQAIQFHQYFSMEEIDSVMLSFLAYNHALPLSIHGILFITTIKLFATDSQLREWMDPIHKLDYIGCYAQTEIGHGSDVQNIETTATFNHLTDEFIIHSPTVSSIKAWPGELGKLATHAVVPARLIVKGTDYGMQIFMVQVRDLQTHSPLQGITVGDLGPKMTWETKDNGFIKFDHVRIPRKNMLGKYSKVTKEGEFTFTGNNPKLAYAAMMVGRDMVSRCSAKALSIATTISVRYSIHRHQFRNETGEDIKVLDYQTQSNKLLPLVALSYAMSCGTQITHALAQLNMKKINTENDLSYIPITHALLAGVKGFYTWWALEGLERARAACGGHGFSSFSGIASTLMIMWPNVTLEGENSIMALQLARYLIKKLRNNSRPKPTGSKSKTTTIEYDNYITEIPTILQEPFKFTTPEEARRLSAAMIKATACFMVQAAGLKVMKGITEQKLTQKECWNKFAGLALVDAAESHIVWYTVQAFQEQIAKVSSEKTRNLLLLLCELLCLDMLISKPNGIMRSGLITGSQFEIIRQAKEDLLKELRPFALLLVDGFGLPDSILKSAIGKTDGKAYENLWEWTQNHNTFDKQDIRKDIMEVLAPYRGKKSIPVMTPRL